MRIRSKSCEIYRIKIIYEQKIFFQQVEREKKNIHCELLFLCDEIKKTEIKNENLKKFLLLLIKNIHLIDICPINKLIKNSYFKYINEIKLELKLLDEKEHFIIKSEAKRLLNQNIKKKFLKIFWNKKINQKYLSFFFIRSKLLSNNYVNTSEIKTLNKILFYFLFIISKIDILIQINLVSNTCYNKLENTYTINGLMDFQNNIKTKIKPLTNRKEIKKTKIFYLNRYFLTKIIIISNKEINFENSICKICLQNAPIILFKTHSFFCYEISKNNEIIELKKNQLNLFLEQISYDKIKIQNELNLIQKKIVKIETNMNELDINSNENNDTIILLERNILNINKLTNFYNENNDYTLPLTDTTNLANKRKSIFSNHLIKKNNYYRELIKNKTLELKFLFLNEELINSTNSLIYHKDFHSHFFESYNKLISYKEQKKHYIEKSFSKYLCLFDLIQIIIEVVAKINFHTILSIFEEKTNFFSTNKSISSDSIQQFCSPSPKNSPLIFKKSIRKGSDQSNSNFSKLKNSDNISMENSLGLKSLKSLCDYKTDSIDEICISKNSFSSNEFDIFSNKSDNLIDYNCSLSERCYNNKKYKSINDKISIEDFKFIKLIQKGGYGNIWLVQRIKTNDYYAMKIQLLSNQISKNQLNFLEQESQIYEKISGDFYAKAIFQFIYKDYLCYVMEYVVGGDFGTLLENLQRFDEETTKFYIAELVLAIENLHLIGILHRDIKPQNMLIDESGHLKITDFGLSSFFLKEDLNMGNKKKYEGKKQIFGTPDYIALEIIDESDFDNPLSDCWSIGIVLFEFLVGLPPFNEENIDDIWENIKKIYIPWDKIDETEDKISNEAKDLINKLLIHKNNRIYFDEIKSHNFFKGIDWVNIRKMKAPIIPEINLKNINEKTINLDYVFNSSKIKIDNKKFIKKNFPIIRNDLLYEANLNETLKKQL